MLLLTLAPSRNINIDSSGHDSSREVLTLRRVVDVDGADAAAGLAAAVVPDGELGEGGLAGCHVRGEGADGSSEDGGESSDGELHFEITEVAWRRLGSGGLKVWVGA